MDARHREGSSIRNVIQSANEALRAAEWMPMTAVRVLIGIFFCISGGTKLLVPAQFTLMEQTLAQSHIRLHRPHNVPGSVLPPDRRPRIPIQTGRSHWSEVTFGVRHRFLEYNRLPISQVRNTDKTY